jgi:AAA+ superfamily predicted ATPase
MRGNGKEMSNNLERAIKHYNISRDILNNLLDKKLKDHSQYYWVTKGIQPSLITNLTHKRDGMNTKTIIQALKKMEELENESSK